MTSLSSSSVPMRRTADRPEWRRIPNTLEVKGPRGRGSPHSLPHYLTSGHSLSRVTVPGLITLYIIHTRVPDPGVTMATSSECRHARNAISCRDGSHIGRSTRASTPPSQPGRHLSPEESGTIPSRGRPRLASAHKAGGAGEGSRGQAGQRGRRGGRSQFRSLSTSSEWCGRLTPSRGSSRPPTATARTHCQCGPPGS